MNSVGRSSHTALLLGFALSLSGCLFISKDGPETGAIPLQASLTANDKIEPVNFALVNTTSEAVKIANKTTDSLIPRFKGLGLSGGINGSVAVGDVLEITIFEAEGGGLFIPKENVTRPDNQVHVPNQQVNARGQIVVPFVSEPIRVAGKTTFEIGRDIARRLATRAIDPQVVVTVVEKRGDYVSVLGDVHGPAKFSLDPGTTSIMTAIARAGGPAHPHYEEIVKIKRNGQVHNAWMTAVVNDPRQDVAVRPGDAVFLEYSPRVFMVLGASPTPGAIGGQNNRRFPFSAAIMSLTEALATGGGLDSLRADPHQVFVFRFEPRSALEQNGIDATNFTSEVIPSAYAFDLSQGGSFFLADQFHMRDKDLVFISDSSSADVQKLLNIVNSMAQSTYFSSLSHYYSR